MSATPAIALANYYDTALATVTLGTNLFHGPVRPPEDASYPTKACFVIQGGGPAAEPFNGQATRLTRPQVRVRVRGDKDDYGGGLTFAKSIFDAGEHAAIAGYVNVRNLDGGVLYLGVDNGGRHEWSWTVEMVLEE